MNTSISKKTRLRDYTGNVYLGIDVHRRTYTIAIRVENEIVKKATIPAQPKVLINLIKNSFPTANIYSAYEAGFSGYNLHYELEGSGINNIICNPASIPIRANDRVKTDKRDAVKIAESLALGLLKGIRIRTKEEVQNRLVSRLRQNLVVDRRRAMLRARMKLIEFDLLPFDYAGVLQIKFVNSIIELPSLSLELKKLLSIIVSQWEFCDKELKNIYTNIKTEAKTNQVINSYLSVPGIGLITAKLLFDELGDLTQFKTEKQLFSFIGFTPAEYSSGEKIRKGRISRKGNPNIRAKLTECAWIAIKKDPALRTAYSRIAAHSGGKKAIIAIARKLIGRARAIIKNGKQYELNYTSLASSS